MWTHHADGCYCQRSSGSLSKDIVPKFECKSLKGLQQARSGRSPLRKACQGAATIFADIKNTNAKSPHVLRSWPKKRGSLVGKLPRFCCRYCEKPGYLALAAS